VFLSHYDSVVFAFRKLVLKGDRARFQLFGDTVNIGKEKQVHGFQSSRDLSRLTALVCTVMFLPFPSAARMESTGKRDMIQISQAMADILYSNGKHHWIVRRSDVVVAKGIGMVKTYWLNPSANKKGSVSGGSERGHSGSDVGTSIESSLHDQCMIKNQRLVDWMTQLLLDHIKKVVSISMYRILIVALRPSS
jgi:hypothetical protein